MSNSWIARALGERYQIFLFMAVDKEPNGCPFKLGFHPGLRHLDHDTIVKIIDGLEDGIHLLRTTPMDDLKFISEERPC